MSTNTPTKPALQHREFVALMALMMSMVALSIDAMLPALAEIGTDLRVAHVNDRQWVVSALFIGLATGQIFYGPISDAVGRKGPVYFGFIVFILGCLISAFAQNFNAMLFGRFLQGVGAAGPRIISIALIRDQYSGDAMARIMSLALMVFVLVPAIAPSIGQAVLWFADWRMIFWILIMMSMVTVIWFGWRQPETLRPEHKIPLSWHNFYAGMHEVLTHRSTCGYTVASGLIFGAFIGYLNTSQQLLQELYGLGAQFPLYFALLVLAIGFASWINSRLVLRFGMRRLSRVALYILSALSICFLLLLYAMDARPSLLLLMAYLIGSFCGIGLLFANFHSLAMEPMGHIAGIASAVVGSLTTVISLLLGAVIGKAYNETVIPLTCGFAILSTASIVVINWIERKR